jgi:predicted Zn-dependent peptidase
VSTFDQALPLLADVALRPTFPQADMERLRKERQTTLLQQRDNPSQLATAAYSRLLFGAEHRYGTGLMGTEAANGAITVADLRTFYQTRYQPQHAHMIVTGDVTAATVMPKLEQAFGSWKNGAAAPAATMPAARKPAARQIYLVNKPGAAQSQIRIGTIGVPRSTPDYFVLDVMNTILGGSFSSRLNQNLREEHGYSYGAASGFGMRLHPGPFVAQAGVQSDKTVESLVEFFKELDGMSTPVPADELSRARNLEALGFPAAFETAGGMAVQLADLVVYSLPESFFDQYVPRIQAVTQADVERAAKEYLQTGQFIVVVAGDLATIEQPIRNAKLGPVTVVPVDDVLK